MGLLLACTAALLGLLVVAWATGAGSETAIPHEAHAPMLRGPDGGTLGAPAWSGYAVGLLIIGILWIALQTGYRGRRWIRFAIAAWSLWYAAAFIALMSAYAAYERGATQIVAGFTVPTAWLVYAIGLSPWALLVVLTYAFTTVYFGAEDQARLDAVIAESRRTLIVRAGEQPADGVRDGPLGAPDRPGDAPAARPDEPAGG